MISIRRRSDRHDETPGYTMNPNRNFSQPYQPSQGFFRNSIYDKEFDLTAPLTREARQAYRKPASDNSYGTLMYEQAAQLQQYLITWLLVADNRGAQIYQHKKEIATSASRIHDGTSHDEYFAWPAGHSLSEGVLRVASIVNPAFDRMAFAEMDTSGSDTLLHGRLEDEDADISPVFLARIISKINLAVSMNSFDRLVLATSQGLNRKLKSRMNYDLRETVIEAFPNDLNEDQLEIGLLRLNELLGRAYGV